jgi:hypothetical protein
MNVTKESVRSVIKPGQKVRLVRQPTWLSRHYWAFKKIVYEISIGDIGEVKGALGMGLGICTCIYIVNEKGDIENPILIRVAWPSGHELVEFDDLEMV